MLGGRAYGYASTILYFLYLIKENKMSKHIEVSDETYEKIKGQLRQDEVASIDALEDMVGKCFFFRTITYHQVGRVKKIVGGFFQLEEGSWIPESGRFMQAIKNGVLEEVEPVGTMFVNIAALSDMIPWVHALPKEQK